MEARELSEFGEILFYLIGGVFFVLGGLITAWIIRPKRPNYEKLTSYECGEDPSGTAWGRFNVRFYIIALVFILFDVEIAFLFPWATVFGHASLIEGTGGVWGWFSLIEVMIFVGILALGLAYAWGKGLLDWIKPQIHYPDYQGTVPKHYYHELNRKIADKYETRTGKKPVADS